MEYQNCQCNIRSWWSNPSLYNFWCYEDEDSTDDLFAQSDGHGLCKREKYDSM